MIERHGLRFSQNADFLIVSKIFFSHGSMARLFGKRTTLDYHVLLQVNAHLCDS